MHAIRTFWRQPRKARWRQWAFQLHLWIGLLLGIWALLMGLSGSVLVFKHEIDASLSPHLFRVEPSRSTASLDEVAAEARRLFPEHFLGGFRQLDQRTQSAYLWIAREDAKGDLIDRYNIHFNQYSGEVLGAKKRYTGFTGSLENLHFFLLMGRNGLALNGILGLGLLSLLFTGIIVWWPGTGAIASSLAISWRAGWKRTNYDLHRTAGVATALVLGISSLTGAYFAYAGTARELLALATGGNGADVSAFYTAPLGAPLAAPPISIDEARRSSIASLPENFRITALTLPRKPAAAYVVDATAPGPVLLSPFRRIFVDQGSGAIVRRLDSQTLNPGIRIAQLAAPIHFGEWGGLPVKVLWAILGLAPGLLSVTGFLMWWNRIVRKRIYGSRL